jgi:two-component system cell cycle response regulator
MDIALPGMDGLTLTRKLKTDDRFRHIPVVAMTAFAMKGDEQKALDAGCAGYITKPIDTRRFPQQVAAFLTAKPASENPHPLKELVIEDDRTDLRLMTAVLESHGHFVGAQTAAEGVRDAIAADRPDLILLDLRLPDLDGLSLVRRLKADAGTKQIPIVAFTAYPESYPREQMLAAGCAAYIVKPIDTRQLASQLEQAAGKSQ